MTNADRIRIESFRHIGCIISGSSQYDVHHLVEGGKRLGDAFTIPLHPWYHRGVPFEGHDNVDMMAKFGPSLERHKKAFVKKYGTERELLAKVNLKLQLRAA